MVTLNIADKGADNATLDYIVKSAPAEAMEGILKSCGYEIEIIDDEAACCDSELEPLEKAQILDLIKARKITVGAKTDAKGKTVQKVQKRILCHNSKTGKEFFQMRMVNADVSSDAKLSKNPLKAFDEHVSRVRRDTTKHITEEAASIEDMKSTPEGAAALEAINKAIGNGSRNGKLSKNLHYTNIRYCKDPVISYNADGTPDKYHACVAIAKNPKTGKDMYFYSQPFREQAEAERAQRAMVLASPNGQAWIEYALDSEGFENPDVRDCIKLMYNYGMKSGNELGSKANQLGDYKTAGATTLTAGNIYIEKKRVRNKETGKTETVEKVYVQYYQQGESGDKAHQQSFEVTDSALAASLKSKKQNAGSDDERIFSCSKDDTLVVCKELFDCNNEDLRSAFGFRKWREARRAILGTNPYAPKRTERINSETGKKEKLTPKRAEMEIVAYIAEQMGVTDTRSVKKYINKGLISLFQTKPKEKAKKQKAKPAAKKKKGGGAKNPENPNGPKAG